MKVVANEVVTAVVTGGYRPDPYLVVTNVTDLSGMVNRERKQVVSAGVTEMRFRRLRGYANPHITPALHAHTTTRAIVFRPALVLLLGLLLTGCNLSSKPSEADAADLAARLTYFADRYGNCYAAVNSTSYGFYTVASVTAVPCERSPVQP